MIIKAYAGLPTTYAPDVGEVIMARRTAADRFIRAVVLVASRNRAGNIRLRVQWLEDNPDAGIERPDCPKRPIKAGGRNVIIVSTDPRDPRLIMQIDRRSAPNA